MRAIIAILIVSLLLVAGCGKNTVDDGKGAAKEAVSGDDSVVEQPPLDENIDVAAADEVNVGELI
ncbi:hypothetical protein J4401_03190 [Candidatus Woesearchaeota archaeon]|nr:hypothetical protein [Candidatus Woesearchaeota archaeon]